MLKGEKNDDSVFEKSIRLLSFVYYQILEEWLKKYMQKSDQNFFN